MTKTLPNFFSDYRVGYTMPLDKKPKITTEKPVSFRAPDEEFCEALNAALDATGATVNDLCVAAIRTGLIPAASLLLEERRKAENEFLKKHSGAASRKK